MPERDPKEVERTIRDLTASYYRKRSPHWSELGPELMARQINEGDCVTFAEEIHARIPEAEAWVFDVPPLSLHVFVGVDDRYYDAEVPSGVPRPEEIPYVRRYEEIFHRPPPPNSVQPVRWGDLGRYC